MIPILVPALVQSMQSLDPASLEALKAVLEDERRAAAFYQAVLNVHSGQRPFVNVIEAEGRHQEALIQQFERFGLEVPVNPWAKNPMVFKGTLAAAVEQAIQAEEANVALYDRWMKVLKDQELRTVFERLRWASQERHLPAFRRHLAR